MPILLDIDNINVVFSTEKCSFLGGAITSANHVQVEFFLRFGSVSLTVEPMWTWMHYVLFMLVIAIIVRSLLGFCWSQADPREWLEVGCPLSYEWSWPEGRDLPVSLPQHSSGKRRASCSYSHPSTFIIILLRLQIFCLEYNLCFTNPENKQTESQWGLGNNELLILCICFSAEVNWKYVSMVLKCWTNIKCICTLRKI